MNTPATQIELISDARAGNRKRSKKALVKAMRRQLSERGMATAEYAVGILAAVALALVLMKVFNSDTFLTLVVKLITTIFSKVLGFL